MTRSDERLTRALQFCVEPGCTERVPGPRCGKHSRGKRKRPLALNRAFGLERTTRKKGDPVA